MDKGLHLKIFCHASVTRDAYVTKFFTPCLPLGRWPVAKHAEGYEVRPEGLLLKNGGALKAEGGVLKKM